MDTRLDIQQNNSSHTASTALRWGKGVLLVAVSSCLTIFLLAPLLLSGLAPAAVRSRYSVLSNATSALHNAVQPSIHDLLEELQHSQQQRWTQMHEAQQRQAQQSNATSQLIHTIQNEVQQLLSGQGHPQQQGNLQPAANHSWPADLHNQTGHSCDQGFFIGPRQVFWKYVSDTLPSLSELYHAEDRVYAVFNTKIHGDGGDRLQELLPGEWTMEFVATAAAGSGTVVKAVDLGRDAHTITFTIAATLPPGFQDHSLLHPVLVTIVMRHKNGTHTYPKVPLCLRPQTLRFNHLVACTEITSSVAQAVPEWVAYHALQGFEQFYLYVNDDLEAVRPQLEPLVKAGLVRVIDWQWPPRFNGEHWYQQAEQVGCLMRMRGQARWVGLHDIDEFIQVIAPDTTVAQFLQQSNALEHVGAFVVRSYVWGSNTDDGVQQEMAKSGKGLVLGQFRSRGTTLDGRKLIANPRGVSYSSVHLVTAGGAEHMLDMDTEMRFNHFKPGQKFDFRDDSLFERLDAVLEEMKALQGSG